MGAAVCEVGGVLHFVVVRGGGGRLVPCRSAIGALARVGTHRFGQDIVNGDALLARDLLERLP